MKTLRQIVDRVSQHSGDIGIGRITHELNQLAPDEIQQVRTGLKHMEFVEQIGRHGNKTDALDYMGVARRTIPQLLASSRRSKLTTLPLP